MREEDERNNHSLWVDLANKNGDGEEDLDHKVIMVEEIEN